MFIDADGKLGTTTSSQRFKDEIKPMDGVSEALYALQPVTFCYKQEIDPAGTSQFGLVAEDVEKVNPDLVVRDKEGKPYSVRYDAGERDVAQRVPQRAPQGGGAKKRLRSNCRTAAKAN